MKTVVIHGSTRENGNTEYLTYQAISKEAGTHIYLRHHHIEPITDYRHTAEGFPPATDDHEKIIDQVLAHDTIVFSTPIYWYSMSGIMKIFIDRFSQILRTPEYAHFREELKNKTVYLIAVGGDTPQLKGLPLIQQMNYICQFYGMTFAGYVIGKASKPGEIRNDTKALKAASLLLES